MASSPSSKNYSSCEECLFPSEISIAWNRWSTAICESSSPLSSVNIKNLKREIEAAQEQFEQANQTVKPALLERVRFLRAKLERLPKTQALHALYKTRAEAIVFQMRHIVSQVLTDPGTNVNSFLEDMVERHELMVDPLASLEAEQAIEDMLDPHMALAEAKAAQAKGN